MCDTCVTAESRIKEQSGNLLSVFRIHLIWFRCYCRCVKFFSSVLNGLESKPQSQYIGNDAKEHKSKINSTTYDTPIDFEAYRCFTHQNIP